MTKLSVKDLLIDQQKRFEERLDFLIQGEDWLTENRQEAYRLEVYGHDQELVMSDVIRSHSRKLLEQTKQTLSRIETGLYGICTKCGKKIEQERLELLPTTTVCKECK